MKVISIQEVVVTIADTATTGTATITTVGNLAQSVVWGSYQISVFSAQTSSDNWQVDMWLSDASTVTIQRNGTVGTITANVFVIQFHSSVIIQKGTFSMATSGLVSNQTITAVNLAKSFSMHYWRITETGQTYDSGPAARQVSGVLTSTTNLQLERDNTATSSGPIDGHWWIAEDPGLTVTQQQFLKTTANPVTSTLASSRSVVLADTFLVASGRTQEPVWNDEGNCDLKLSSSTQVQVRDGFNNSETDIVEAYIVEDSALNVQQFQLANTSAASGTQAITSVDLSLSIVVPVMPPATLACTAWNNGQFDKRIIKFKFDSSTQISWVRSEGHLETYLTYNIITFEAGTSFTKEQEGFRFRNDDGSEATATWKANQDVNITEAKNTNIRLRTLIDITGTPASEGVTLQYKRTDENADEWRDV